MGLLPSRQAPSQNADDGVATYSYKYPPKSGFYFGSHFMMGGERFETTQPETYLFGDNTDLNFLGPKPVPFPYHQPSSTEPIRTLQCLAAARRDSIKFTKTVVDGKRAPCQPTEDKTEDVNSDQSTSASPSAHIDLTSFEETQYNIEFVLDCDAPCSVTIYYFANEEIGPDGLRYTSKRPELTSSTYRYDIGANQAFSHPELTFDPCLYRADELLYRDETETIPVVIHCVVDSPDNGSGPQSHSTLAIVEKSAEGHGFILKPLKQKIYVDGVCYLLQEIYGIENKHLTTIGTNSGGQSSSSNGNQTEDAMLQSSNEESGTECVVCMSELRDTLILPCRHLCLCSGCAETLRYKASACPICRAPFRALLQVKTLRRIRGGAGPVASGHSMDQATMECNVSTTAASFLNRYETVPLIEALNGPMEAPTFVLPIHPIPASSQPAGTSSVPATTRRAGSGTKRTPKRPKGKKIRTPATIQEVLTPQSLVHPRAKESVPSVSREKADTSDRCSTSVSPKFHGQLLPGQTDDDPLNSDDEYMEAHSVACGEVVTKPELEGPNETDDENGVTIDSAENSIHGCQGLETKEVDDVEPVSEQPPKQECSTASSKPVEGTVRGGTDTPTSSNSVSSVTSANSSHPLLPTDQQRVMDSAEG